MWSYPRSGLIVSNHTAPGQDSPSPTLPTQVRIHRLQPHHPRSGLIVSSHTSPAQDSPSPTTPPQVRTHGLQPHHPRPGLVVSNHTSPGQDLSSPATPPQVGTCSHATLGRVGRAGACWCLQCFEQVALYPSQDTYPGKGKSPRHLRLQLNTFRGKTSFRHRMLGVPISSL